MKSYFLCLLSLLLLLGTSVKKLGEPKNKVSFIQKLEQGEKVKIAALGTSLTGGTWRWFDVLQEWLDKDYPGQLTYFNEGVGASASSYPPGKSGIEKAKVVVKYQPDVVFIEFAVNDSYKPYDISLNNSRCNLENIIQTLRETNQGVEIILQTMNVVIDMPELDMVESTKRAELPRYLKMYKKVAKKNNLLLVDHYTNWKRYLKKEGRVEYIKLVTDGIHPNLEGYRMILLPELKRVLQ